MSGVLRIIASTCAAAAPLILSVLPAVAAGQESGPPSADAVAMLLESRTQLLETVDSVVEIRRTKGRDHDRYFDDSVVYDRRVAEFFGTPFQERESFTKTDADPVPPQYMRIEAAPSAGAVRISGFTGTPNGRLDNVRFVECFTGTRWERYYPDYHTGARIHLGETQKSPSLLALFGIEMPEVGVTKTPTRISDFIRTCDRTGALASVRLVENRDGVPDSTVELVMYLPQPDLPPDFQMYDKLTLDIDLALNAAPVRIIRESVQRKGGEYVECDMPRRVEAVWSDFESYEGGELHLPLSLTITETDSIAHPLDESGFVPRRVDGKPVIFNGGPQIDYTRTDVRLYEVRLDSMSAVSLKVNEPLPEPLCMSEYPPGTVVQDDTRASAH